jgi:carbonic anhydrase/acetyltransferase-like protein (isoleucine patch superfamily)
LITERKVFEEGSLITGAPARAMRKLDDQQRQIIPFSAAHYVENWKRYKTGLRRSDRD